MFFWGGARGRDKFVYNNCKVIHVFVEFGIVQWIKVLISFPFVTVLKHLAYLTAIKINCSHWLRKHDLVTNQFPFALTIKSPLQKVCFFLLVVFLLRVLTTLIIFIYFMFILLSFIFVLTMTTRTVCGDRPFQPVIICDWPPTFMLAVWTFIIICELFNVMLYPELEIDWYSDWKINDVECCQ